MACKKTLMEKLFKKECEDKIEVCTPNFCACGCLDEDADTDDVVVLKNATIIFNDEKNTRKHKKRLCICDEYIISIQSAEE